MILKTCSKCKERKPHSEFYRNNRNKDGLQCRCKECHNKQVQQYKKQNPERLREYYKQYYKENVERCRENQARYHKKNAEKIRERQRQWRKENSEKERQRVRQWYKGNREKKNQISKQYRKNQPAAVYKIENTKTGQVYIGQSTMYKDRWIQHKSLLRRNKHKNHKLQEDHNKYGLDAFEFNIIKEFPPDTTSDVLLKEEIKMITEYNQRGENLYNIRESEE